MPGSGQGCGGRLREDGGALGGGDEFTESEQDVLAAGEAGEFA